VHAPARARSQVQGHSPRAWFGQSVLRGANQAKLFPHRPQQLTSAANLQHLNQRIFWNRNEQRPNHASLPRSTPPIPNSYDASRIYGPNSPGQQRQHQRTQSLTNNTPPNTRIARCVIRVANHHLPRLRGRAAPLLEFGIPAAPVLLNDSLADRVEHNVGGAVEIQLGHQPAAVCFHRVQADVE